MGKVSEAFIPEGPTWVLLGFQSIREVSVQQHQEPVDTDCYSSDLQQLKARVSVMYRLPERNVVRASRDFRGDVYAEVVQPKALDALKQVIATNTAENAIKRRDQMRPDIIRLTQAAVGDLVEIVDIPIRDTELSPELEKAIEQKQVQEQQSLAKVYEKQIATADKEIAITKAQAEAESVRIKGEALKNSPGVVDLEIVKKWDGKSPLYVSTTAGGASTLLPLK